jgi:cyclophilin family peptidyl-prolyl cis-trans isomerase
VSNRLLVICLALALVASLGACNSSGGADRVAVFETDYGRIVFEFLPETAPKHVAAFQAMIEDGFYDGTRFHRVNANRFIQGGDPNSKDDDPSDDGMGQPGQPTIPAEFSTELKHTRGIVSAARKGNDDDSATSQFFICADNEPAFDGKYSIFGRVVDGMSVVDLISRAPLRTDNPQFRERPVAPVTIKRAYLAKREDLGLPPKS